MQTHVIQQLDNGFFDSDARAPVVANYRGPGIALERINQFARVRPRSLGNLDTSRLAGARDNAVKARLKLVPDADSRSYRAASVLGFDRTISLASMFLADAVQRHHPQPYEWAVDEALRFQQRAADSITRGTAFDAFDPTAGGAGYPGLISQGAVSELTPITPSSFERIFPVFRTKVPIYPGQTHYTATRFTAAGRASPISAESNEAMNIIDVGGQTELRATTWIGVAMRESFLAKQQAMIPGLGAVDRDQVVMSRDLAMGAEKNRIQWYGSGAMVGLLNSLEKATTRVRDASNNAVNVRTSDTADVLEALVLTLQQIMEAKGGLVPFDTCIMSESLALLFCRQLRSTEGPTAETMISFLREKVFKAALPGVTRFEIVQELNNIGDNGQTAAEKGSALTGVHGMLLTSSGQYGISRVPIIGPIQLPVVTDGLIDMWYTVEQFGQPYISGLGYNVLLEFESA